MSGASFKETERALKDQNAAFEKVRYEERFEVSPEGLAHLERLSDKARARDVYLVCQCDFEQRCHGDLLLLTARHRFKALVSQIPFTYPTYEGRLN